LIEVGFGVRGIVVLALVLLYCLKVVDMYRGAGRLESMEMSQVRSL
jgi:hypothetical protein